MISLDQVLLLEQKVESAVAKIAQLQAENDALRSKCSELTNALSSKSEQLSSFESDQSKIESGILKALDRLNSIENSVLKAAGQASFAQQQNVAQNIQSNTTEQVFSQQVQQTQVQPAQTEPQNINPYANAAQEQQIQQENDFSQSNSTVADSGNQPSFFDLNQTAEQPAENNSAENTNSEQDNGQFDIF